jgi:hypothetical protein
VSQPHPRIDAPSPPADLEEERELRAITALLRSLPAPEPPGDLTDRVLARIARYESRPRIVRGILEHVPQRGLATALAAGVGCLLVLSTLRGAPFTSTPDGEVALAPMVARRVTDAALADPGELRPRRPVVPWFVSAAVIDGPPASALAPLPIGLGAPDASIAGSHTSPMDRRLDRQLNHLLLDPPSFYQRLDRVREPDRFVARLAERAARRGDATDIALELRQRVPHHSHTSWLMERMLGAVLAQRAPTR